MKRAGVSRDTASASLSAEIDRLDRHLYAPAGGDWSAAGLVKVVGTLRPRASDASPRRPALPALNPEGHGEM